VRGGSLKEWRKCGGCAYAARRGRGGHGRNGMSERARAGGG
jgi:hypothetical protein